MPRKFVQPTKNTSPLRLFGRVIFLRQLLKAKQDKKYVMVTVIIYLSGAFLLASSIVEVQVQLFQGGKHNKKGFCDIFTPLFVPTEHDGFLW